MQASLPRQPDIEEVSPEPSLSLTDESSWPSTPESKGIEASTCYCVGEHDCPEREFILN